MFITVKYGDDKSEIFNPACKNCNLLQAIKFRCDLEKEDIVDLSDQLGTVKHLHKRLDENALNFFEERETLILLKVEKQEEEGVKYVPLLADMMSDTEFIARINPERPIKSRHSHTTSHRTNSPQEPRSAKGRKGSLEPVQAAGVAKMGRRMSKRLSPKDFAGLPGVKKS